MGSGPIQTKLIAVQEQEEENVSQQGMEYELRQLILPQFLGGLEKLITDADRMPMGAVISSTVQVKELAL